MRRAGAASPGESLAETNKVIPNSFRVFFVAVRGAETASLREELQLTETLQHTGGVSQSLFQVSFIHAVIQKAIHQTLLLHGNLGPEEGKVLSLCLLFGGRSEMRQNR